MEESWKFVTAPPVDYGTECRSIEFEVVDPTAEVDARLEEIEGKIADLDIAIDHLTNHADKLDYSVAVASGILTGFVDALFVGKTEIDIEKIQAELEEKFHTANDSAFKHKVKKENGERGWVSSTKYHRLEDLAHHPTVIGLLAAILVRFFRIAVFCNSGKKSIFIIEEKKNPQTKKKETRDMCIAWSLAVLSGVLVWMAEMAKKKKTLDKNIPEPIRKLIATLSKAPAVIELMMIADTWIGHIMSDVSTPEGVPGIRLSIYDEILLIPGVGQTKLSAIVDDLYAEKTMNILASAGVAFTAIRKQLLPVVVNETLVRAFYFVRHAIAEYQAKESFNNIDWSLTMPIGNRTVERMMTIASGTFFVFDSMDSLVEGAMDIKKNGGTLANQFILRLNFVGIGRFTVALGTDAYMGLKKGQKSGMRMRLKAEALYLLQAKIYCGDRLMWVAVQDADQSLESFYDTMRQLSRQMTQDIKTVQGSVSELRQLDTTAIEKNNEGLTDTLLDEL